jgi:hypothetical protein
MMKLDLQTKSSMRQVLRATAELGAPRPVKVMNIAKPLQQALYCVQSRMPSSQVTWFAAWPGALIPA